jgi:hypothetical protein
MQWKRTLIQMALVCLVPAGAAAAVVPPQFYTPSVVAGARANVKRQAWAKTEADTILAYAKPWMAMSYDQVWNFLSEQSVPRAVWTAKPARCPIHGSLEAYGDYAWSTIPEARWKVRCPVGGETWPTNDFEAFYKSGKDAHNVFDAGRANRSLLYSQDGARPYGVDDGNGYVDGAGNRYYFVGFYAFWGIWNRVARSDYNAITVLSQAYLLTGDAEYGRRAALLLARAADLYKAMDAGAWAARGVPINDGGTGKGKVLGSIWDDEVANHLMLAYDALGSLLDTDPTLQSLLGAYGKRYGLDPQQTGPAIRKHIETGMLAPMAQAVVERQIRSNEGRAQYTYALAALLQGPGAAAPALDWLNAPGDNVHGGGHLPQLFWELLDRDGAGTEGSPYYNGVWLEALQPLAAVMRKLNRHEDLLTQYPRLRQLMLYPSRLMNLGRYYPHVGDAGGTGSPEAPLKNLTARYVNAFAQFADADAAVAAFRLNGETVAGLHAGLFDGDASEIEDQVAAAVLARGRYWEHSDDMNGYGLAQHRAGRGDTARTLWLYWGRTGHGGNHPHADRLNLGLMAYGLDLMPDLGYPEYAIAWPTTQGWIKNTVAHNTVVVDGRRQAQSYSGDQKVFADTPYVQLSEVDGGAVYPQTSLYRRAAALIQIDAARSYAVDVFRVRGGAEHVYSLHAAEGEAAASGVTLTPQPGTYAGPGVAFGNFYDEPFSGTYAGSGFQYLDNVAASGDAPAAFSVDWAVRDTYGQLPQALNGKVHVRYTAVGNTARVALADGHPAQNNGANPRRLRYLLLKNTGANLDSKFVGVIEPYVNAPAVRDVRALALEDPESGAVALAVTLDNGRTDYVFSALDDLPHTSADGRFTFRGSYAVYAEKGGAMAFAFVAGGGGLTVGGRAVARTQTVAGRIAQAAYDESGHATVTLDRLAGSDASLAGQWIDFAPRTGEADANFRITSTATRHAATQVSLGDADAIAGLRDAANPAAGLRPALAAGDGYRIPGVAFVRGPAYAPLDFETPPALTPASVRRAQAAPKADMQPVGCAQSPGGLGMGICAPLGLVWLGLRRRRARRPA